MNNTIVLDMSSGNVSHNSKDTIKKMIDAVDEATGVFKKQVILKFQLFEKEIDGNVPLTHECFDYAYQYGTSKGFLVTASIFDVNSLFWLIKNPVPFVKLACGQVPMSELMQYIPRGMKILYSSCKRDGLFALPMFMNWRIDQGMACIPDYPATLEDYEKEFGPELLTGSVSDHTAGLALWNKYHPMFWEKHFCLEHSAEKDCGQYALDPKQLKELFNGMKTEKVMPENPFEKKDK